MGHKPESRNRQTDNWQTDSEFIQSLPRGAVGMDTNVRIIGSGLFSCTLLVLIPVMDIVASLYAIILKL